jgi:hypothetical protein
MLQSIHDKIYNCEENDGTLQFCSYSLMDAGFVFIELLLGENKLSSLNFRLNVK